MSEDRPNGGYTVYQPIKGVDRGWSWMAHGPNGIKDGYAVTESEAEEAAREAARTLGWRE